MSVACSSKERPIAHNTVNEVSASKDGEDYAISNVDVEKKTPLEFKKGDFIWKPIDIKLHLLPKETWPDKQFISAACKGGYKVYGWDGMLIEIPFSWKVDSVRFDELSIRIQTAKNGVYILPPTDLLKVAFNVHATDKTPAELIALWAIYIKSK